MLDDRNGSVLALPAREQAEQRWQAAVAVLLKAAEHMAGRSGLSQGSFGRALPRRLKYRCLRLHRADRLQQGRIVYCFRCCR